jgi:NADH-quinone oxidoreductase subunit N
LEDLRGLLWRRPALGGVLAAMLLSLAGLPLTAGFMGKLYLLKAGVGAGLWALVAILAASSAIGLYYYLRVIVVLCGTGEPGAGLGAPVAAGGERLGAKAPAPAPAGRAACPATAGLALAILAAMLVWLGVHPGPTIRVIQGLFSGPGW